MRPIKVFISSPDDLFPEREVIDRVLKDLNEDPVFRERFKLIPYRWEGHSPAQAGPYAQEVVNKGMLAPEDADVMVCMLWLKMGSPTKGMIDPDTGKERKEYISGTYYEFITAYRQWKKTENTPTPAPNVKVYRCVRAPNLDQIDFEQAGKVDAFFKRFDSGDLTGIYTKFTTPADLYRVVRADLVNYLHKLPSEVASADATVDDGRRARQPGATQSASPLGRYRRLEVIGSGSFATVWRAEAPLPGGGTHQVALKILHQSATEDHRRRFVRELQLLYAVPHPHIIHLHDWHDSPEGLFVVMPLMPRTLKARLGEPLSAADALALLTPLASALDFAHDKKIIHRDLKPDNILLYESGQPVLADFGLAHSNIDDGLRSREGAVMGTPAYMSPEQCRGEKPDARSDVYALGLIAYEMLTGHAPFTGNAISVMEAQKTQPIPYPDHLSPPLSASIFNVLQRCTAKDREQRYESAGEFVETLRRAVYDPTVENLDHYIRVYLDQKTAALDLIVRDYVALTGRRKVLNAPPAPASIPSTSAAAGLGPDHEIRMRRLQQQRAKQSADYHASAAHAAEAITDVSARLMTVKQGVLLGEPGTGKSWTLVHLIYRLATAWADLKDDDAKRATCHIPVQILLNQFKGQMGEGKDAKKLTFEAYVQQQLLALKPYWGTLHQQKRLFLLCDALNEMPRQSPLDGRDLVAEVRNYLKTCDLPYVVSCRVRDYEVSHDLDGLGTLEEVRLRDFDLDQIWAAIQQRMGVTDATTDAEREEAARDSEALWQAMGDPDRDALRRLWAKMAAAGAETRFWDGPIQWGDGEWDEHQAGQAMHRGARLIPLARNPFMLNVIGNIYEDAQGGLPTKRAGLFQSFVHTLFKREQAQAAARKDPPLDEAAIERALVAVAAQMQKRRVTVLSRADAEAAIGTPDAASRLAEASAASLLVTDNATVRFSHQLLQEYFAVRVLLEAMEATPPRPATDFYGAEWWHSGEWAETIVMLGEFVSLTEGMAGLNRVVRWLAPASPDEALRVYREHGDKPALSQIEPSTRDTLIAAAHAKIDGEDVQNDPQPIGRAAAYRVLGWFDADDRPGIALPPPLPAVLGVRERGSGGEGFWCAPIPPGGFWYGEGKKNAPPPDPRKRYRAGDTSSRGTWTEIAYPFQIARHPVTNAQFGPFIDDPQGYNNREWWTEAGWAWKTEDNRTAPDEYYDPRFRLPNHPRINITWYESVAFCNWLTARLYPEVWEAARAIWQTTPLTEIKGLIRLPTEQEWERAARGTDGRIYAWGDEFDALKGNSYDSASRIDMTSAVGIFAAGESPSGALDTVGNVWEWSLSNFMKSNININNTDERVLRGGSWSSGYVSRLRVGFRHWDAPVFRDDLVGCRLARS